MKTRFVCDITNARLARNKIDRNEGFVAKYVVERVIYLAKRPFLHLREYLLEDDPNIALRLLTTSVRNCLAIRFLWFCLINLCHKSLTF